MPSNSRLASFTRPWGLVLLSLRLHWDALKDAIRRNGIYGLAHSQQIRSNAAAKLLSITAPGFIAYEDTTVVPSLVKKASGVILDLGPGPGNQIHRFDSSSVEQIYGIEPNTNFKSRLEVKCQEHGLHDRYQLVACGIEDSERLRKEGITEGTVDSILCIQVLCAVDDTKSVMKELYKLLKPGGKFIFWEHGCSKNRWTNLMQVFWNPAWSTFIGCHLTREVLGDILDSGEWENSKEIEEPEDPVNLLPRIQGVLIKRKE